MLSKNCQVLFRNKKGIFKVHFIGIGGIGISALAQWLLRNPQIYADLTQTRADKTKQIRLVMSSSDLENSDIIKDLRKLGAKIKIGPHKADNLDSNTDLVIYSFAVRPDNPELKKARKLKIKVLSYPEALGILTKKFYTIAVCGAHGKSTTTAMLALVLIKAGFDPTVVIGTKLKEFRGGNFRIGESQFLIIEADEYKAAFLNYWPKMIVLTNIDAEHLDYYKNLRGVSGAFKKFIGHLPKNGVLVANNDDKNSKQLTVSSKQNNKKYYSINQKEAVEIKKIIKIPGKHNISNALAVLTAARALRINDKIIFKALSEYKGAWRRFELIKTDLRAAPEGRASPFRRGLQRGSTRTSATTEARKITIISDYAHHPTEIKATLQAVAEKFPKKRIICAFQPHQEERLKILFNDFVEAFKGIKNLILVESFKVAGREKGKKASKTRFLAEIIRKKYGQEVLYAPSLKKAEELIKNNAKFGDVILIMGAGDIYKINYKLQITNPKK